MCLVADPSSLVDIIFPLEQDEHGCLVPACFHESLPRGMLVCFSKDYRISLSFVGIPSGKARLTSEPRILGTSALKNLRCPIQLELKNQIHSINHSEIEILATVILHSPVPIIPTALLIRLSVFPTALVAIEACNKTIRVDDSLPKQMVDCFSYSFKQSFRGQMRNNVTYLSEFDTNLLISACFTDSGFLRHAQETVTIPLTCFATIHTLSKAEKTAKVFAHMLTFRLQMPEFLDHFLMHEFQSQSDFKENQDFSICFVSTSSYSEVQILLQPLQSYLGFQSNNPELLQIVLNHIRSFLLLEADLKCEPIQNVFRLASLDFGNSCKEIASKDFFCQTKSLENLFHQALIECRRLRKRLAFHANELQVHLKLYTLVRNQFLRKERLISSKFNPLIDDILEKFAMKVNAGLNDMLELQAKTREVITLLKMLIDLSSLAKTNDRSDTKESTKVNFCCKELDELVPSTMKCEIDRALNVETSIMGLEESLEGQLEAILNICHVKQNCDHCSIIDRLIVKLGGVLQLNVTGRIVLEA